ncbi:permease [Saccharicrinis sp. FJH2]|uniref:permease n=1 Tax=Saccharicrinis sp. FJH65 TaxID=3344659 RepID=UPI0035F34F96
MSHFFQQWGEASYTSFSFFWMALWAFMLGYVISSMIQIFVTEKRMKQSMGKPGIGSILKGTFFGFISSSCSFSALASTKSLFQKGASFISSVAFLLSSTNLVIELGIIISIFLGWQFLAGEYIGGIMLILFSWLLVKLIRPDKLIKKARQNLGSPDEDEDMEKPFSEKVKSMEAWSKTGKQYAMEWKMVWKDVTIGFTIAGIVSAFVPDSFFQTLFIHTGDGQQSYSFLTLLQHVIVGPLVAFMTFIGSMGNIPLAALLYGKGVSFAGIMAFIFSDLVVFPVLRINAKYYGWKMAFFILLLLFLSLIITSLTLHYGLDIMNLLPDGSQQKITDNMGFKIDYTFFLNIAFLIISGILAWFGFVKGKHVMHHKEMTPKSPALENTLKYIALACYVWLIAGFVIHFVV